MSHIAAVRPRLCIVILIDFDCLGTIQSWVAIRQMPTNERAEGGVGGIEARLPLLDQEIDAVQVRRLPLQQPVPPHAAANGCRPPRVIAQGQGVPFAFWKRLRMCVDMRRGV